MRTLFPQCTVYTQSNSKYRDLSTNTVICIDIEVEYFCDNIIYHYPTSVCIWYGRLSSIPFHSGIFHIPYRNFCSIPFHTMPCHALDLGLIPDRVKPKTIKIGIHSFPAWRSAIKGTVWSLCRVSGVVDRWQLDSKTERSLRCLLAKATWWIKCNYIALHNDTQRWQRLDS